MTKNAWRTIKTSLETHIKHRESAIEEENKRYREAHQTDVETMDEALEKKHIHEGALEMAQKIRNEMLKQEMVC